ncbi:MAG: hypothetical protein Q4F67_14890 [Propionibacteriaceae bacterium]|nr:hypothetical protein [Propionibacteriaceae bacterium]
MSDTTAPTEGQKPAENGGQTGFTPPATQADLDRIIADRISRERSKFADYEELKAKAAKFDEATEAAKTEAEKQAEALAAAQAKIAEYETREQIAAWKAEVAKDAGVPAEALAGTTREEIAAHAEVIKSLIPSGDAKKGAIGPYVPPQGTGTPPALNSSALEDSLRAALGIN